jgi:PAS domain S-box-containing protein
MTAKPSYEELERRIQELEKAKSERNLAEDRLKKIFDNTQDAIFIHDLEGKILDVNDKMCRIYGLTREEALEVTIEDVSSSKMSMKVLLERWQKVLNGEKLVFEWEARRPKDGSVFNVEVSIQMLSFHDKDIILANIRDITERKRAEKALREKSNFLQNIIDTTSDLVSVTDMEGNFKFIGSSHSILGYDQDLLAGKNVMELVHSDDYQEVATAFAEFLANREDGRKVEYRYLRADGNYIWFETVGKFILDDAGNPKEILFTSTDFTARKRAEGELKRIEWMLSRKPVPDIDAQTEPHDQGYGDLTELNQDGIILKSIGQERLKSFANDYLELLGTSSAIYEVNGDYAFGIFASGWCRMMDRASRTLCNTPDNIEALTSGRWLCHESCWTDCSKEAIAKRAPVDIECNGGIRLYAVPIFAGGNVIGVINFGYGDPPKDPEKLKMLADVYHLNHDDLVREATAYDSRPPYIIEMAKKRLNSTAKLIGSMVETKQAMEALRKSEQEKSMILDNVGNIIAYHDKNEGIVWANQSYLDSIGYITGSPVQMADVKGRHCYELWKLKIPCVGCPVDIALQNGITTEAELSPENQPHWPATQGSWFIKATPIRDTQDNVIGAIEIAIDITERKQAEDERLHLEWKLQQAQKAESLGRMAGAIAHHFNNQLSVMMGNLELVLDDLPDDAENRENLFQAFEAGHKAAEVSQQMLRYLGHISGSRTTINLSDVCRQSLALLQSALPSGVTLNVDFPDFGPLVHADSGQIQQVLTNLFINAQESLPDNQGVIGLIIQTVSHEDISSSNRFPLDWHPQDNPYACLEISDTGCGISKEDVVKIFDPFYTTKFTGRGMGLSVTMGILKTHNGCITVDNEPGSGCVFRIYLPVMTEKKPVTHEKVTTPKGTVGNGGTVLLIEDEVSVRNMAKKMLSQLGYKVIEAQDGVEAVRLFQAHQNEIDCVFSDLTMPRMNGWETLTALREKGADVPVILASGYDQDTVMAGDHPELPQAFLNKPYSMAALKDVLKEVIKL